MSAQDKSALWNQLKGGLGDSFKSIVDKQYVEYTEAQLRSLIELHLKVPIQKTVTLEIDKDYIDPSRMDTEQSTEQVDFDLSRFQQVYEAIEADRPDVHGTFPEEPPQATRTVTQSDAPSPAPEAEQARLATPIGHLPGGLPVYQSPEGPVVQVLHYLVPLNDQPASIAGLNFYNDDEDKPVRVDHQGRIWYFDEIQKPAIPKPRARSLVEYETANVEKVEIRNSKGHLKEIIEVAGEQRHTAQYKRTLPSYQVGVYRDPRMPFRIHVYNGVRGFDYIDVVRYFGGSDLVPESCKTMYVQNDLCYDIRSVRRTIEEIHQEMQMKGLAR